MRRALIILVVEDDENDSLLLAMALNKAGAGGVISFVADGKEGIDYLQHQPPYADRSQHPFPDLLVLDLNTPRVDGFGVLRWLQAHPALRPMFVAVVSGSVSGEEVEHVRALGADLFVPKSSDYAQLVGVVHELGEHLPTGLLETVPNRALEGQRKAA